MPTLTQHFLSMAYNNAWSNHRLLNACARLSQQQFEAPRAGFFPSIKATLNHILTVDWFYIDALERATAGRPPHPNYGVFFAPEQPYASCAALQPEQRQVDARLIAYCARLDDAALARGITILRGDKVQREECHRLLDHLFLHQTHHRGQAHAMLSGAGVDPPQLDEFFCAMDAPLRAPDFAALGWSEAAIWGKVAAFSTKEPT